MEEGSIVNLNINIKYELTQGYLILVSRPKLEYLDISLSGIINQKTLQQNCSQIIFKENITSTEDTLNDRLSGLNSLLFSNLGGILHN